MEQLASQSAEMLEVSAISLGKVIPVERRLFTDMRDESCPTLPFFSASRHFTFVASRLTVFGFRAGLAPAHPALPWL
jgi:hypothetical protein